MLVADSILPLGPRNLGALPAAPLPFLLPGVLAEEEGVDGRLRDEAGVPGAVWEKEAAWAFIFERRWVMALGVTSVFGFRVSGLFDR